MALSVLPGSEPEKDQTQVALPRRLNRLIDDAEVELPWLRLNRFPIHRNLGHIRMQSGDYIQRLGEIVRVGRG